MKVLLALVIFVHPYFAFAECNFKTDIVRIDSNTLKYSNDCHKEFGLTRQNLKYAEEEIVELRKNIALKDLVIQKTEEQVDLWKAESIEQNIRLNNVEAAAEKNKWLWFAIGVVATGAAVYTAGQLN